MNRLTKYQIKRVIDLYDLGYSRKYISEETGVSQTSVWGLTKLREMKNPHTGKLFENLREYYDYRDSLNGRKKYADSNVNFGNSENARLFFARLISRRLNEIGESQEWLARKIGVSRTSIGYYMCGENVPRKEKLNRLCDVLGINMGSISSLL